MGNNSAFTAFEATVIAVYDEGVLTPALLTKIGKVYADSDIDSGGKVGTLTKIDRLDIEGAVIKTMGGKLPTRPDLPKNHREWTPEQEQANEEYNEAVYASFSRITKKWDW